MINFKWEMRGDRELQLKLGQAGGKAEEIARMSIGRLALKLQTMVKEEKLTGQVLKVRTGRLRRSITQRVESSAGKVTGIVGTNIEYAAAHEFGFEGTVTVKEHLRRIREEGRFVLKKSKFRDFGVWTKVQGKPTGKVVTVKAHTRHVDLPKRSFLRSALEDLQAKGIDAEEVQRAARLLLAPVRK